tara:strand:- start:934 stop:1464 length:531 start_codon:yes stop_codon:yes gene_type:complete
MGWLVYGLYVALLAGASDPYGLHQEKKQKYVKKIIKQTEAQGEDPYEFLAIAITESSLKPRAYSHTHDTGLFQVNCRWWYKQFKYKSIKVCKTAMFNPNINISKGIYILTSFRKKYKQCRGNLAYRCYNGGQGWYRSKNKHKIINYAKKVQQRKAMLHKHYKKLIEDIRTNLKNRS